MNERGIYMAETDVWQELHDEKEHSEFMERLLEARHGEGWDHLTIDDARKAREKEEHHE